MLMEVWYNPKELVRLNGTVAVRCPRSRFQLQISFCDRRRQRQIPLTLRRRIHALASVRIATVIASAAALVVCLGGESARAQTPTQTPDSGSSSRSSRRSGSASATNPATDSQLETRQRNRERDRQENSKAEKTPEPKPGAKEGDKPQATVRGRQAPRGEARAAAGGTARGATSVEFKMAANPQSNVLYMESLGFAPTMHVLATEGEQFGTRVVFANGRKALFDTVEVSLRYDPSVLIPLGIDDSEISDLLGGTPLAKVDRSKGIIAYRAEFAEAINTDRTILFKVAWKARQATGLTRIHFLNSNDYPSRVLSGETNILLPRPQDGAEEIEVTEATGLIGAEVSINAQGSSENAFEGAGSEIEALALAAQIAEGTAQGGIQLSLRPRTRRLSQGNEFLVDVVYRNPRGVDFDRVRLTMRFDPAVLEVVDHDEGNWITRDINIFDGDYHEALPFDFHIRNKAENASGMIYYEMGFSQKAMVPPEGVMATIKFRARKPVPTADIRFEYDESLGQPATAVSFLGFNLIGVPGDRARSLSSTVVRVD